MKFAGACCRGIRERASQIGMILSTRGLNKEERLQAPVPFFTQMFGWGYHPEIAVPKGVEPKHARILRPA